MSAAGRIAAACGRGLAALARALPDLIRDAVGLAGVALIGYGAWLVYPPAGFMASGALLVVAVLLLSVIERRAG